MCYWKKHRKDTEQKISLIVVWPLIPRKAGRGWEQSAALAHAQEHFISKPVIKNTAQTPARSLWKGNVASAGVSPWEWVQDRDQWHHPKLSNYCTKR